MLRFKWELGVKLGFLLSTQTTKSLEKLAFPDKQYKELHANELRGKKKIKSNLILVKSKPVT